FGYSPNHSPACSLIPAPFQRTALSFKSGCKDKEIFYNKKPIRIFFTIFFVIASPKSSNLLLLAITNAMAELRLYLHRNFKLLSVPPFWGKQGCKGTASFWINQNVFEKNL
ncbi:MAG: hypothetical protein LBL04_09095, partial [Bacteroidales bacterium]|nr:hypothetical protein [Bacteroidales bacterium]